MENRVTEFFREKGFDLTVQFTGEDTATVEKAAAVLGVAEGRIAKSLAFVLKDGTPIVLVVEGTARIDNRKYKDLFHCKASMLSHEDTLAVTGFPVGGVCPFALPEQVRVYLDQSLQKYDTVFPAAGTPDSAVRIEVARFAEYTGGEWVDVCKLPEAAQ
ncbi:MAG: YbaK/EbsC family protein [Pygmaiobacter sp.]